jgi:hypothetical protein
MLNAMRTADLRELEATAQRGTMRRPAADALLAVIMPHTPLLGSLVPKGDGRTVGPEPKRPDPFYHSAGHEQFRKAVLKHAGTLRVDRAVRARSICRASLRDVRRII